MPDHAEHRSEEPERRHIDDLRRDPTGGGSLSPTPGANPKGAVEGIGGAGGSSGAGAVRAESVEIGSLSGIDSARSNAGTSDADDIASTDQGSSGAASGHRRSTRGGGGMGAQTRGPNSETTPEPEDPFKQSPR